MALTSIASVTTDRAEYTRYERHAARFADDPADVADPGDPGLVTVTIAATGDPASPISLTIEDATTGQIVAAVTVLTDAAGTSAAHTFDLDADPLAYDTDGINRAKHGTYIARATDPDAPTPDATSPAFRIAAVTVGQLRSQWLRGIDARDTTRVRGTAYGITGLTVHDTYDIERGGYPLTYDTVSRALSWREGPSVTIPPTGPALAFDLWNATLDSRVTISADPAALPAPILAPADPLISGHTMHDFPPLADRDLAIAIDDAYAALAAYLRVTGIEPLTVTTPRLRAEFPHADRYDHTARPWRRVTALSRGQTIETGLRRILAIHAMRGFLNETQVISIDESWRAVSALNGTVSFVPSGNGRFPAPTPLTMAGWWGWAGSYGDRIPAYWHICATIGLPDLHDDLGRLIRAYIARRAATAILAIAGRARQGALQSEQFGRDGVSLSLPYTSGQYGMYTDQITAHKEYCDETRGIIARRMIGYAGVS